MQKILSIADLDRIREQVLEARKSREASILLCCGPGCQAYGCRKLAEAFGEEIAKRDLGSRVELRMTGCRGFCERGALLVIQPRELFYQQVKPEDVPEIIEKTIAIPGRGRPFSTRTRCLSTAGRCVWFSRPLET
jgi:NADH-quinone oxidoreductase subunit F